ncbi:hypothetical protein Micbo1qcDRAFT_180795, partial [Microdochium bolleyi]
SFVQAPRSRPASSRIRSFRIPPELATFEPYARHGYAWATSAAAEVLPLADCPTVESVQSLWCLGIYWFAMSDTPRVGITMGTIIIGTSRSAIAYASCATFQPLNSCSTPTPTQRGSGSSGRANDDAQLESMRCCFWACWSSMCTAAIPDAYARNAWQEAAGVPLPTRTNPDGPREYMDKSWQCLPIGGRRPGEEATTTCDTIDAAFLKLIGIWARVQILVRHASTPPDVAQFEALTAKTQDVYSAASFPATRPRSGGTADSSDHARLVGLHSLYHLCRMVLLCPLVALFSGHQHQHQQQEQEQQPSAAAAAAHAVRSKAETAVEHALAQHRLVREYTAAAAGGDATRISPLTAFASFVSASILLTAVKPELSSHTQSSSSSCAAPAGDGDGDGGVISNSLAQVLLIAEGTLHLLETLQTFWKPLEPLAAELRRRLLGFPALSSLAETHIPSPPTGQLRISLTQANSPGQGAGAIETMYVREQAREQEPRQWQQEQDQRGSGLASHQDTSSALLGSVPQEAQRAQQQQQQQDAGLGLLEDSLLGYDTMLDLQLTSDGWDMELLSFCPPNFV